MDFNRRENRGDAELTEIIEILCVTLCLLRVTLRNSF
jgi:hypothetical protein